MQGKNISKIGGAVIQLFSKCANKVCKQVGFIRRRDKAKLTAPMFFKTLTLSCLSKKEISLEEMCQIFKKSNVKITKQGLHQRFNKQATSLMKGLFEESVALFKTEQSNVIDLLKCFSSIKLLDSSTITLPAHMKDVYQGCGAKGAESGIKIQTLFDYINGCLDILSITEAKKSDNSFKDHLLQIEKGALYLQDLGYSKIESFGVIQDNGAYFISRHFNQTRVFNTNGELIDFAKMLRSSKPFFSKIVTLGIKHKLTVRMVAQCLSKEDAEKRIRHIKENARRQGRTPTQETLELAKWSICITNIPEKMLKDEHVYLIYSLRWQIELFFKLCKKDAGIDKINSKKDDRILCEIYAKLICISMFLHISSPVRWRGEQELSFSKAYNCLRTQVFSLLKALDSAYRLKLFLSNYLDDLRDFAMKDIKRKSPPTHKRLMDVVGQKELA